MAFPQHSLIFSSRSEILRENGAALFIKRFESLICSLLKFAYAGRRGFTVVAPDKLWWAKLEYF
jgi:tRNA1(Val) A37 N6-methylase TrmN6